MGYRRRNQITVGILTCACLKVDQLTIPQGKILPERRNAGGWQSDFLRSLCESGTEYSDPSREKRIVEVRRRRIDYSRSGWSLISLPKFLDRRTQPKGFPSRTTKTCQSQSKNTIRAGTEYLRLPRLIMAYSITPAVWWPHKTFQTSLMSSDHNFLLQTSQHLTARSHR